MSSAMGNNIKVQVFGQSHSEGLGVVIDGLPAGEEIDLVKINDFLQRRAGGKNKYSTARKEKDIPKIISGLVENRTCGAPLCAIFENADTKSQDYDGLQYIPRPSHADYTAHMKHHAFEDRRGGGHFSGRLTLPLCFAGAVCKQILERHGIYIGAHIHSIGKVRDKSFDTVGLCKEDFTEALQEFPTLDKSAGMQMIKIMEEMAEQGDSIGGCVECGVLGLPVGLGDPMFDNLESLLSYGLFAIPAVKGVEFGAGFGVTEMTGSQCNDNFYFDGDMVKTESNNSGGIQGGISNGMPVIFRVAFKPTPSIYSMQKSVNLKTKNAIDLKIKGRHDPCIVPRAVPCVEAVAAMVLADVFLGGKK